MTVAIEIIKMDESHRLVMQDFWLSLSQRERRIRFNYCASDDALKDQIKLIDFDLDYVLGVFLGEKLLGTAELMAEKTFDISVTGEIGIVLSKCIHGLGIASNIISKIRKKASLLGLKELIFHIQDDNESMRKLAIRNGFNLTKLDGEITARSSVTSHLMLKY